MGKTSKFFLAGLIGAVAGAVGGLLMAPQSGEETIEEIKGVAAELAVGLKHSREETEKRVRDAFGSASKKARSSYRKIRKEVVLKLAEAKRTGKEMDINKYNIVVEDVVKKFQTDLKYSEDSAKKIAKYLKKDWEKIKSVATSSPKELTKS